MYLYIQIVIYQERSFSATIASLLITRSLGQYRLSMYIKLSFSLKDFLKVFKFAFFIPHYFENNDSYK